MPDFLKKFIVQLKDFWNNLEKSHKQRIVVSSIVITISVLVLMSFITKPDYTVLFSNVEQKDMTEMMEILDEDKLWYSVNNNGRDIIVNTKDVSKAKISLMKSGFLKGGMTFEDAISMINITLTESDKKNIWEHKRIADLERTIASLDNIESATVNLALPEKSIFLLSDERTENPTAIVTIRPKTQLTQSQVQGIVMIVAGSVENMNPANVTVVDNKSNILNSDYNDGYISRVNSQEEMRSKKALELEQSVYKYFNVGQSDNFDTIRVVANPYLDFDIVSSQTQSIRNPEGMDSGAVTGFQTRSESHEGGETGIEPGVGTNPGTNESYQTGDSSSSSTIRDETRNYDYDRILTNQEKAVGNIINEKSTIAISLWYGERVNDETKLTDEFLNQVKTAASTMTGIPTSNISVYKYKKAPYEEPVKPTSAKVADVIKEYGYFAVLVLIVFALLIALLPRKSEMPEPVTADGLSEQDLKGLSKEQYSEIKLEEGSEIKQQIDKFVKQRPDAVAQLLRNWIADDWNI